MFKQVFTLVAVGCMLSACAGRSDHQTFYLAEQGDYDAALSAAEAAQGNGIDGFFLGTGASQCRDYNAVVTVHVARGDFSEASEACRDYDNECAVVPDANLCFSYSMDDLSSAGSDQDLAARLTEEAKESLHFRWLMLRDDYEGRALKRPIY